MFAVANVAPGVFGLYFVGHDFLSWIILYSKPSRTIHLHQFTPAVSVQRSPVVRCAIVHETYHAMAIATVDMTARGMCVALIFFDSASCFGDCGFFFREYHAIFSSAQAAHQFIYYQHILSASVCQAAGGTSRWPPHISAHGMKLRTAQR